MKSIGFLSLILVASSLIAPIARADVNLQSPPSGTVTNMPRLSRLLHGPKGKPIVTKRDWEKERERIKEKWFAVMGDLTAERAPLKPEFLKEEDLGTYRRQYVRYEIEPGVAVDGYLLRPQGLKSKTAPAVVVFHPTTPFQARGVAGLESEYPKEKHQAVHLVQRGYVVWCPRNFIFDEDTGEAPTRKMWEKNTEKVQGRHPKWTGIGRMTFDAIRAADFVESLPYVDKNRIGCIGHSLGAKVALFGPAFDERYKVSVSSEGGIGLRFSNWEAPWYFGDVINQPGFELENHQILGLVAPRPFLLLAGESADGDRSWAFINAASSVYRLYGRPQNLGWFNHREGHAYSANARAVAEEFLDRHLKPETPVQK